MCLLNLLAIFNRTSKHCWERNLKNVAPQKQNAICKTRAQYTKRIALLNYLKHIALQQLMLRTQVLTKNL
jgi:hypothetical protein